MMRIKVVLSHRYDGVLFKGSFGFYGLKPGKKYEVMVLVKNEIGWSEMHKSFVFTTPLHDIEEPPLVGNSSDAKMKDGGPVFIEILMFAILLFFNIFNAMD